MSLGCQVVSRVEVGMFDRLQGSAISQACEQFVKTDSRSYVRRVVCRKKTV